MKLNESIRPYVPSTLVVLLLLSVPLIAMQFTAEVNWSFGDFLLAALLLMTTGVLLTRASLAVADLRIKIATGLTLLSVLTLIWINLAVGLIGSEGTWQNMLFFLIPVILLMGAFRSSLNPVGMVYTLLAMALFQALVILLLAFILPSTDLLLPELILCSIFILIWLLAARLYQSAVS